MRLAFFLLVFLPLSAQAENWPQWRGPYGDNHAAPEATAPTAWNENSNIVWRTPVPGRGHSSPILVGDKIYLTTCDEELAQQSLLVFDRATGKLLKQTVAHEGKIAPRIHGNNTYASPTAACDGKRVYALFENDFAAWVTAFDLDGNRLWQERVGGFDPQQYQFGFGSSPVLLGNLLFVATEYDGPESGIYAINTANGKQVWKAPRPQRLSYSTPSVIRPNGRPQLIISGNQMIAVYDPGSGKEIWSTKASTFATCGTMIWDESTGLAFASGGYPDQFTLAIQTDGNHEVVWQHRVKCYEQSMLLVDGYVYAVADDGIAHCYRATDGEEMWKHRLRGPVSSSPLLVGNTIYASNERGTTYVFAASPDGFQSLGENQLGDEAFATPAPCDGRLYHRYASKASGARQEYLVAIGER